MSNIYIQEPPTNGKVVLHTTSGDVEIELWSKETPKACRNFVQLCLEGYYTNTIFHRIVPGFIIQGGDPTGTGHGGQSIHGEPFADEFHSRLRFVRRGLVAMANAGPNDNGSQFFFTLDRSDELQNKHTIFGRVGGDTIYNVLKMGELETDEDERPLYPPRVLDTEVLSNPFDDIIPRYTREERMAAEAVATAKAEEKKPKKKEKKNLALLSFGDEAPDLDATAFEGIKIKSSHDMLEDDPRLSKEVVVAEPSQANNDLAAPTTKLDNTRAAIERIAKRTHNEANGRGHDDDDIAGEEGDAEDFDRRMRDQVRKAHQALKGEEGESGGKSKSATVRDSIEQMKQDIRNIDKRKEIEDDDEPKSNKKAKGVSMLEMEKKKYILGGKAFVGGKKGKKKGDDAETMAKLMAFQKKLLSAKPDDPPSKRPSSPVDTADHSMDLEDVGAPPAADAPSSSSAMPCALHSIPNCESCNDMFGRVDEGSEEGWLGHRLVFERDLRGKDLMQRKESTDDYLVIDPRVRNEKAMKEEKEIMARKKQVVGEAFRRRDGGGGGRDRERDQGRERVQGGERDGGRQRDRRR